MNGFRYMVAFVVCSLAFAFGCEQKEKVLDIETPALDIEVEKSSDNGEVDVKIDDK